MGSFKVFHQHWIIATIAIGALGLTACGKNVAKKAETVGTDYTTTQSSGNWWSTSTSTGTSTGTGTSTTTGTSTGTNTSTGAPNYAFQVRGTGYTTVSIGPVPANKILKVRFMPTEQDRKVAGTGFAPLYAKMGVYITASPLRNNGKPTSNGQATEMLSNGHCRDKTTTDPYCAYFQLGEAQWSRVITISDFTRTCSASDTACRQNVMIHVHMPNNDFRCMIYGDRCPWAQMHETHPWVGNIEVATDDTVGF